MSMSRKIIFSQFKTMDALKVSLSSVFFVEIETKSNQIKINNNFSLLGISFRFIRKIGILHISFDTTGVCYSYS